MYLSIGNDMAVREHSVIGIFDLDNTTTSKRTREFLEQCEKEGQVVPCDDLPKAFLLTDEYQLPKVRSIPRRWQQDLKRTVPDKIRPQMFHVKHLGAFSVRPVGADSIRPKSQIFASTRMNAPTIVGGRLIVLLYRADANRFLRGKELGRLGNCRLEKRRDIQAMGIFNRLHPQNGVGA